MTYDEPARVTALLDAQRQAGLLFDAVVEQRLIAPGRTERQVSDDIRDLATSLLGVRRFWHKRIVRAGPNTLLPYAENPPDRVIGEDDIAFCDFGPIFEEWEADFGRTYVLGDDPVKHHLRDDLARLFDAGRAYFDATPEITGEQLYAHVCALARDAGWHYGNVHCGHLVGEFPHEKIAGDESDCYITAGNDLVMRRADRTGRTCHWILEIHLVDEGRQFGGFYEQLLDLA
jgi:Xaa-Pro dipeptidase